MEESSGVESLGGDEISLLAEELVQLSVKSSVVVPIQLDVQKPLRRRIFVSEGIQWKSWISFKYENLATSLYMDKWGMGSRTSGMFTAPKSRYEDEMFKCHNEGDIQEEGSVVESIERLNGIDSMLEDKSKSVKKTSWKRIRPRVMMNKDKEESIMRKRKSAKIETNECSMMNSREDEYKRSKR
ncbi:hypothetical protein Golax_004110 [Gossypium laxum]|uniref:Uncharacterized protein n=1 Tax=Gossypium laxum TaxID=34288 RepID=A0A7J9AHH9_9ROSI|nr:hypothetical protein [Gossypium laxum]